MASKIEIWSQASVLIGNGIQQSETADNEFIEQVTAIYTSVYESMLASHRWNFARKKAQLAQVVETPINQWQYAYQLPVDKLAVYNATSSYQIFGDKLFTNASEISIDYIYKVAEGDLPGYFADALAMRLAGLLAYPLTNDGNLTGALAGESRKAWQDAAAIDSKQHPTEEITDRPLVSARHY